MDSQGFGPWTDARTMNKNLLQQVKGINKMTGFPKQFPASGLQQISLGFFCFLSFRCCITGGFSERDTLKWIEDIYLYINCLFFLISQKFTLSPLLQLLMERKSTFHLSGLQWSIPNQYSGSFSIKARPPPPLPFLPISSFWKRIASPCQGEPLWLIGRQLLNASEAQQSQF